MLAACLLLVVAPAFQESEGLVRTGDHFQVISEIAIDEHVDRALEIVEEAWTVTTQTLGVPDRETDRLITLRLLHLRGSLPGDLHYSPNLPEKLLRATHLPMRTAGPIANRAAQLIVKRIVPTSDSLPLWLSEGLAGYVEEKSLFESGFGELPTREPRFATRRVRCQRIAKRAARPTLEQFLTGDLQELSAADQEALRSLFFGQLARDEDRFGTFIKAVPQIGGGADYSRALHGMLRSVYGPELWSQFWNRVAELKPDWEVSQGGLATHKSGWVQHSRRMQDSLAWRVGKPLIGEWSLRGKFELLNTQSSAGIVLGAPLVADRASDSLPSHIAVRFVHGHHVVVSKYEAKTASYEDLATGSFDAPAKKPTAFRITRTETGIMVVIGESKPLKVSLDQPVNGAWGFTTRRGSVSIWSGIEVR